ncbi:MAG: hypothetical protein A2W03_09020 [Candidatus Aminicenantes bacterium RBG_16_63_16]|nr:MAG: hypothetical protein A2W03_09020 [Candidatus Aminicenantes bacterium RBG_16_63_16]
MKTYDALAVGRPEVLLPRQGLDLTKWAVVACDQYTSEPEYWNKVQEFVGEEPSTLNLIYPEVYLGEADPDSRIARIREHMKLYLDRRIFEEYEGFIYVERQTGAGVRKGLLACLDLESYDYRKGAESLIRATEGTILSRIPPRVRIREGAPLELPHIMVLIDDPQNSVLGPVEARRDNLRKLYDFDVMRGSGRLRGFAVEGDALEMAVIGGLKTLADPRVFARKYGLKPETPVLLYAMGDGNHSLATAKSIWEKSREASGDRCAAMGSPLRYALVEVVNLHDPALVFEPIHRVLFDLVPGRNIVEEFIMFYSGRSRYSDCQTPLMMRALVDGQPAGGHRIGLILPEGMGVLEVDKPDSNIAVGTLQNFLDAFMSEKKGAQEIDYVHGAETVMRLGQEHGSAVFYLPAMDKRQLFKTVILDGALPRKTFSMGEAWEKRFYMEARRLAPR